MIAGLVAAKDVMTNDYVSWEVTCKLAKHLVHCTPASTHRWPPRMANAAHLASADAIYMCQLVSMIIRHHERRKSCCPLHYSSRQIRKFLYIELHHSSSGIDCTEDICLYC